MTQQADKLATLHAMQKELHEYLCGEVNRLRQDAGLVVTGINVEVSAVHDRIDATGKIGLVVKDGWVSSVYVSAVDTKTNAHITVPYRKHDSV